MSHAAEPTRKWVEQTHNLFHEANAARTCDEWAHIIVTRLAKALGANQGTLWWWATDDDQIELIDFKSAGDLDPPGITPRWGAWQKRVPDGDPLISIGSYWTCKRRGAKCPPAFMRKWDFLPVAEAISAISAHAKGDGVAISRKRILDDRSWMRASEIQNHADHPLAKYPIADILGGADPHHRYPDNTLALISL